MKSKIGILTVGKFFVADSGLRSNFSDVAATVSYANAVACVSQQRIII